MGWILYRTVEKLKWPVLCKIDRYVDYTMSRENLRSENKVKFLCPFTRVGKIRKSPIYRGVDLWNSLKVQHYRAENRKRFKYLLKNALTEIVA